VFGVHVLVVVLIICWFILATAPLQGYGYARSTKGNKLGFVPHVGGVGASRVKYEIAIFGVRVRRRNETEPAERTNKSEAQPPLSTMIPAASQCFFNDLM